MKSSWKPDRKVTYAAAWGIVTNLLISQTWRIGIQLTAEESAAVTLLVMSGVSYITRKVKGAKS